MHRKFHPTGVRTHNLQIMDSTCHVPKMLIVTTEPSGTPFLPISEKEGERECVCVWASKRTALLFVYWIFHFKSFQITVFMLCALEAAFIHVRDLPECMKWSLVKSYSLSQRLRSIGQCIDFLSWSRWCLPLVHPISGARRDFHREKEWQIGR